jgi:hypothetical protein
MNVSGKLYGIGVFLYQNATVSSLQEMTHPARSRVQVVRITRVEVMEDHVKIAFRSFQEQMVMIRHQTETVDSRPVTVGRRLQIAKKPFIILFDPEDVLAFIASGSDVIECIWILNS